MPGTNYEVLIQKLNTFIRKYYLNNLLRGFIFLGAGLFTAYLAVTLTEYFGNLNTTWRSVLFYFFVVINLAMLFWLVIPALLAWLKLSKTISHDEAARIIGNHFGHVNDKLLNTLQLKKQIEANPAGAQLLQASIDQRIRELNPVSFPTAVNLKNNRKHLKWLLPPLAVICMIGFAAPSILTDSTERLIKHNKYFAPVAPYRLILLNKDLNAIQGEDLQLQIQLDGNNLPADIYIETGGNTFRLDKQSVSRFNYTFSNLQQNVSFNLVGNGYTSQQYQIKVSSKPTLISFDAELRYPAYLHKPGDYLQNAGDITVPEGTTVQWHIRTQHATSAKIVYDGVENTLAVAAKDSFTYQKTILKPLHYSLSAVNEQVKQITDSSAYHIQTITDKAPAINVQQRDDSVSVKALYFNGSIQDDYGFSRLVFKYRKGNKTYSVPVKADLSSTNSSFFYFWDLRSLSLKGGETISYHFEVADNDCVHGPKITSTPEQVLNMPNEQQIQEQLEAGSKAVAEKTASALKLANQIERETQKLNRMLVEKNNLSFDEKKQVEQLLQKREELNQLIKDIQQENAKNQYNRKENQQQSEELLNKQKQMAELFKNLLDPKTDDILKKLNELLQNNNKEQTQDELSRMQMDNRSMKKELDRVLDLYKKLLFDQKVEQNIEQLNKLAADQQKLADESNKANNNTDKNNLLQKQQQLQQQFNDVKKSLNELEKENKESGGKMDFEDSQKEQQAIEQQMDKSSKELQQNNRKQAAKAQQNAAQQMQQLSKKMQQQQQEGEQAQSNINIQQLRELLKSLVNSSFNQEKLILQLRGMSGQNPAYVGIAPQQQNIKDNLRTAQDSLYALSKRVPQIQASVNREVAAINENIDKAISAMGERRTPEVKRNQQYAMTAMNNLALLLSEALEQLQNMQSNAGGKGSKSQSLSQLAKMQQQLNRNMEQARQQMQQQGKSAQGQGSSEQLAKMARQQQMVREALQKLSSEQMKDGKGNGDLDKISKEMEQTENDIVNRKITDETIKRQQQIQTRLLDAERAEQQREQDNRRESNAGKEFPPGYIKALQQYQQQKNKQTEQIRTILPAFNLYYKEKIQSYFEHLNGK